MMIKRNIVVTGGNRGIGLEIIKGLDLNEYHVILACRDVVSGKKAMNEAGIEADVIGLDLCSVDSIISFSSQIKERYGKLDVLVNNAGVYDNSGTLLSFMSYKFEKCWVSNALGPYLLTRELAGLLDASPQAKCIFMCSMAGHLKRLDFETIKGSKVHESYGQSKYADLLLSAYFSDKHLNWQVIAVHPGYTNTNIFEGRKPGLARKLIRIVTDIAAQTPADGAKPAIHAIRESLPSGTYVVPKGFRELYGLPCLKRAKDYYYQNDYQQFVEFLEKDLV